MDQAPSNKQVAALLRRIAGILDIQGENRFKVMAYRRAADNIEALPRDLADYWREGRLREIPGIGEALSEKLDELLRTGRMSYLEELEQQVPPGVVEMLEIPEVGPKTARLVWERLGITSIEQLREAAETGRLRQLPGMGAKTEQRILAGIQALTHRSQRIPIGEARPVALALLSGLRASVSSLVKTAVAGSLRRWRETIGDVDLLVAAEDPEPVMEAFTRLPDVAEVILRGSTKTSIRTRDGLQVDLRVVPPERWGTALQYFTGSQAHNIALRERALKRGLSLSEYALKREDGKEILCAEEEEVYAALELPWIPPELRENRGEIEAAEEGRLPRLIEVSDLEGELHAHSTWSDGTATIEEMAEAARARGYRYLVITDHSESLGVTGGLTVERLREQRAEIERLNKRWSDFRLLHGIEVEIRADGTLDYPDEVLAELDCVVASIHTGLRQDREQITARALAAVRNPHVDILGHPSGRLLGRREESAVDLEVVLQTAAETGVAMEINAHPSRLDLDDVHVRRAIELGVPLVINCDAHSPADFDLIEYGVATARRGWAAPEHVLNALPLERLEEWLRRRGSGG
ncbi:MAG TPA: DNA polymerase/3'-5' exonuclease PolX [Caldilineae bacterium]|nr:DNA polymerase/3'-5' exonuclease PolX [Caldilineae bacterium]